MKTREDLKALYDTVLRPELEQFESQRRRIVKKLILAAFALLAVLAAVGAVLFGVVQDKRPLIAFSGFIGIALLYGFHHYITKAYTREFKEKIIRRIVSFFDKNLTYEATSCIPEAQFVGSRIFRQPPDRYTGDDLVRGKLGSTRVEFSEIKAECKTQKGGGGANRQSEWTTLFKGLFFCADFNKNFKGKTVVLPDAAEGLFGHVGQTLQSWNVGRGELIRLEDVEFEKLFVVYGDDQVEARYILSTSLMRRIVDFKKKSNRRIYLSFVDSKVCVAISYTRNLFEPRVFKSVADFAPIQGYFEDLILAAGLVEDLNLNTRIWSKP